MNATAEQKARLVAAASAAMQSRRPGEALTLLTQAQALDPSDPWIFVRTGMAHKLRGNPAGAIAAFDAALVLEPTNVVALLHKATLIEQVSGKRAAVATYRAALMARKGAGPIPADMHSHVTRAQTVVDETASELHDHLLSCTSDVGQELKGVERARFIEAVEVFATGRPPYRQEPLLLHYPGLPAQPFLDRRHFPWLDELEACSSIIASEAMGLLQGDQESFAPYIAYAPGVPVNQWRDLNHSLKWKSSWLWRDGTRIDEVCEKCPATVALMQRLPLLIQPDFAPTVVFSALAPRTHIPPHTGSTNARVLCHLPLILPGPARFRVGGETRAWRFGEAWVFDDTIEHEAWNDADEVRVILIFDVWNPYLSLAEREVVTRLLQASASFYSEHQSGAAQPQGFAN